MKNAKAMNNSQSNKFYKKFKIENKANTDPLKHEM